MIPRASVIATIECESSAASRSRTRCSAAAIARSFELDPRAPVALLLPIVSVVTRTESKRKVWPIADILRALHQVESGGRIEAPDGDGGLAIGPLQIHRAYWADAQKQDPQLGGAYEDCRNLTYAERVVRAYMQRHAASAWALGEAETIARIHNGGPQGKDRAATLGYWQSVRRHLPD